MKKVFLILGVFTSLSMFSQEKEDTEETKGRFFGGFETNAQWYVNDPARKINPSTDPYYQGKTVRSNSYLPLNYNYGKWTTGVQVEGYLPMALLNYNPKYKGANVGTYYANFKTEKVEATAGYFYDQFGSGLALRNWEDRSLGVNNSIRGGRFAYKPSDNVSFTGLYGRQRTGFNVSNGQIYGFNSDLNLSNLFKMEESDLSMGVSYVGRYEKAVVDQNGVLPTYNNLTSVYGGRVNYTKSSFYFSSEYNYKTPDAVFDTSTGQVDNNFVKPGSALLANMGYAKKGFGVDATFRRMENMLFFSERNAESYPQFQATSFNYNDKIMNFIPSLTKQHHFSLANIYVYQAQASVRFVPSGNLAKAGEIGGQIDFFYEFKKESALGGKYGTKVALNAANWFNLKGNYATPVAGVPFKPDYTTQFFGIGQKYYSDYNIEITKKLSPNVNGGITYINQYYNDQLITFAAPVLVKTNIIAADLNYKLGGGKSFKFDLQHMWASADRGNWAAGSVEYNHNSKISVYASDMWNYGYTPIPGNVNLIDPYTDAFKIHFYNIGTAYKVGSTRFAVGYGRQRGGLVCAGGVCRVVPPSTGLNFSVNTSF